MNADRFMFSIVCDDVRHEASGKLSYIGVYRDTILVPSFPAILPKLYFVLTVRTIAEKPFKALTFKVLADDAELLRADVDTAQVRGDSEAGTDHWLSATMICGMQGAQFQKPTILKLRAETELGELQGGTIDVRVLSERDRAQLKNVDAAVPN